MWHTWEGQFVQTAYQIAWTSQHATGGGRESGAQQVSHMDRRKPMQPFTCSYFDWFLILYRPELFVISQQATVAEATPTPHPVHETPSFITSPTTAHTGTYFRPIQSTTSLQRATAGPLLTTDFTIQGNQYFLLRQERMIRKYQP